MSMSVYSMYCTYLLESMVKTYFMIVSIIALLMKALLIHRRLSDNRYNMSGWMPVNLRLEDMFFLPPFLHSSPKSNVKPDQDMLIHSPRRHAHY